MDLSTLDTRAAASEGATLHLKHPVTGSPLVTPPKPGEDEGEPVTITLLGLDSEEFQAADRRLRNRRLADIGKRGPANRMTAEQIDSEAISLLVQVTVGWSNLGFGADALPFSAEAAASIYRKLPWVREQVDEFVADRGNYLKA